MVDYKRKSEAAIKKRNLETNDQNAVKPVIRTAEGMARLAIMWGEVDGGDVSRGMLARLVRGARMGRAARRAARIIEA